MNKYMVPIVVVFCLVMISACHSNENNYRQAYELAQQNQMGDIEPTIYNKIREEAKPSIMIIGNDSVRTRTEALSVVGDAGYSVRPLQRYNVVVGQYKMLFNAKSHRQRLLDLGYDAFLLQTGEPLYYVAIGSADEIEDAISLVKKYNKECSGQFVGIDEPVIEIPLEIQLK